MKKQTKTWLLVIGAILLISTVLLIFSFTKMSVFEFGYEDTYGVQCNGNLCFNAKPSTTSIVRGWNIWKDSSEHYFTKDFPQFNERELNKTCWLEINSGMGLISVYGKTQYVSGLSTLQCYLSSPDYVTLNGVYVPYNLTEGSLYRTIRHYTNGGAMTFPGQSLEVKIDFSTSEFPSTIQENPIPSPNPQENNTPNPQPQPSPQPTPQPQPEPKSNTVKYIAYGFILLVVVAIVVLIVKLFKKR